MAESQPQDNEPQASEPKRGGSVVGRLLIAGFMGAVVISECLFAYFWLPSADEVTARVENMAKNAQNNGSREGREEEGGLAVEMDLGAFTITNHRLTSESTFRTDFHLWGTVRDSDKETFRKLFERNQNRFRNLVLEEIQNSERTDLTDAGLGSIKRRLLAKSNTLFGKPLLREVLFAEYTFVEL
ncbi:MAG: hypothetical protein ACODAD_03210 [Planctomycetota bacterium]